MGEVYTAQQAAVSVKVIHYGQHVHILSYYSSVDRGRGLYSRLYFTLAVIQRLSRSLVRLLVATSYQIKCGDASESVGDLAHDWDKMAAYRGCVGDLSSDFACVCTAFLEGLTVTTIFVTPFHWVYKLYLPGR